jgi:hypothetical protein
MDCAASLLIDTYKRERTSDVPVRPMIISRPTIAKAQRQIPIPKKPNLRFSKNFGLRCWGLQVTFTIMKG